jgi:hypothetical protein
MTRCMVELPLSTTLTQLLVEVRSLTATPCSLGTMQVDAPYCQYDIVGIGQSYILFRGRMKAPYSFGAQLPESTEVQLFAPEDIPFDEASGGGGGGLGGTMCWCVCGLPFWVGRDWRLALAAEKPGKARKSQREHSCFPRLPPSYTRASSLTRVHTSAPTRCHPAAGLLLCDYSPSCLPGRPQGRLLALPPRQHSEASRGGTQRPRDLPVGQPLRHPHPPGHYEVVMGC